MFVGDGDIRKGWLYDLESGDAMVGDDLAHSALECLSSVRDIIM